MTNEEKKQKRVEYIQDILFKYTTEDPILTPEELAFAFLFHLDLERFLKAIKRESKKKF
jgi:hypothetical protein